MYVFNPGFDQRFFDVYMQIIIFTRYPVPGKTKTRLVPVLGPKKAARIQKLMTEQVLDLARKFCSKNFSGKTKIIIFYTGAGLKDFKAWLGNDLEYKLQPPGDLGFKMGQALKMACKSGTEEVVLVGSDLPGLSQEILEQAFATLVRSDLVLGPAEDGGYYLIGMKSFYPQLFQNIDWGTGRVFDQTIEIVKRLNLDCNILETLQDLDRPEDLKLLGRYSRLTNFFSEKPLLSIIIPTLNEEGKLSDTLSRLQWARSIETIVVDGGSQDRTCQIARQFGTRLLEVFGGRADQQNAGAALAKGELLLFLHADTLLPYGYDELIRSVLETPGTVAGAFRFQIDHPRKVLRIVEIFTNLRSSLLKLPYGDQGLFMEKKIFHELGGFSHMPIMEDFELVLRLRRRGRLVTLNSAVLTSGRRWQQFGVLRTTLINQIIILGFFAGLSSSKLKAIYSSNKKVKPKADDKQRFF